MSETRKFGDVEKTYWQNEPMHLEVGPEDELRLVAGAVKKSRPNEMIERVAKAIMNADDADNSWDEIHRDDALKYARAAINAMREPTENMLKAFYGDIPIDQQLGQDWRDMIDAALK